MKASRPPTMEKQLRAVALVVATLVACMLPAVGVYGGFASQRVIQTTEAEINSRLVSQLIHGNPDLWRVETLRLEALLSRRPIDKTPEVRSLHELDGTVIAQSRDPLATPVLTEATPVYDAGVAVATLRVQRSLRPLIVQGISLGLLGLLLGATAYVATRTLPLRALRRAHDALLHAATYDALTGLPNRGLFMDRLQHALTRPQPRPPLALLYLDLDHFKNVNDSLGHAAGDAVLTHVARMLETLSRAAPPAGRRAGDAPANVARLAGDEFALFVEGPESIESARSTAARILRVLEDPIGVEGRSVHLSGSIGIAWCPNGEACDADTLLKQADMAMYRAKALGRNNAQFFDAELQQKHLARIELDQALRGALQRGEFLLHYQPKAALRDGRIEGVEALLRWQRPGHGMVPPDRFIPSLEESRLIHEVGAWVIATACAQLAAWDRAGLPRLTMAVNLSAHQFRDPALPDIVSRALEAAGIAADRLELELTESLLMDDSEASRQVLGRLYGVGVRFAIDDFGTGHSSLAYLKRFKIDTLKIDRAFVRGLPSNSDNRAICGAMVALAHNLELSVVCEGVEEAAQLDFLRSIDCDAVQGFHLARPMPPQDIGPWLAQRTEALTGAARRLTASSPAPQAMA